MSTLCVQLFLGGFLFVFATLDSLVAPTRELLSLHPKLERDVDSSAEDFFHGYRILGRTQISRLQL